MVVWRLLALLGLLCLTGCQLLGGLEVESVATSVEKPSNIAVYLSVKNGGAPASDLSEANFKVFENGTEIRAEESQLTLLDQSLVSVHHTLLLLDMGSLKGDAERRKTLARAAASFARRVRQTQAITVYAFDGGADIRLIGDYARSGQNAAEAPASGDDLQAKLESFSAHDTSRNLYGAVIEGLKQLDARLMRHQKPVRAGALVTFTLGPDLAGRVSEDQLYNTLESTKHDLFSVGVGEGDDPMFNAIGRSGTTRAAGPASIGIAFDEAAQKVAAASQRFYLLQYCSPARAGQRLLRIEVVTQNQEGGEVSGSFESEFDATGFGSGCNPRRTPRFVQRAAPALQPEPASSQTPVPGGQPSNEAPEPPADDDAPIVPPPDKYKPE